MTSYLTSRHGQSLISVSTDYSQCIPGASTPSTPTSTAAPAPSACTTSTPNSPPSTAGNLTFTGINISGFDFGCDTSGTCNVTAVWGPIAGPPFYGNDGAAQMQHFVQNDGHNVFRLPVGWQYLTNGAISGTLNETNAAIYDRLVQACLDTGAHCVIDIHNYARFNGAVRLTISLLIPYNKHKVTDHRPRWTI